MITNQDKVISTKIDYEVKVFGKWRSVKDTIKYLQSQHCSLGTCFNPYNEKDCRAFALEQKAMGYAVRKKVQTKVIVTQLCIVDL